VILPLTWNLLLSLGPPLSPQLPECPEVLAFVTRWRFFGPQRGSGLRSPFSLLPRPFFPRVLLVAFPPKPPRFPPPPQLMVHPAFALFTTHLFTYIKSSISRTSQSVRDTKITIPPSGISHSDTPWLTLTFSSGCPPPPPFHETFPPSNFPPQFSFSPPGQVSPRIVIYCCVIMSSPISPCFFF